MNKKYIFIIIYIMFIITMIFSDNIYTNSKIGIKFKIPEGCIFKNENEQIEKYKYNIYIISDQNFLGVEKGSQEINKIIIAFKNRDKKGIFEKDYNFIEYKEISNNVIAIYFDSGAEILSGVFSKLFYFIKNDELIVIYVTYRYPYPKDEKDETTLGYRISKCTDGEILLKTDKQIKDYLKNGTKIKADVPKELIGLYKVFDELISSIEFFDPKPVTYKSVVDNLRLRETPDLKGKFIRSLIKGEKLELIETGKSETINGVKGNWVKVKTEKGEVGWCFDAYLEEVKADDVKKN